MFLLAAGPAALGHAVETRLGPLTITRAATVKGSYDDNIFLSATNSVASGIATFTHDIGFAYETKRSKLTAGYEINLVQYDKLPGVNNAVNQDASLLWSHETGQGSSLGVSDDFKATNDPASSELVERTRRNENDAVVTAETGLGPDLFVGADAHHTLHNYLKRSLGDLLNRKVVDVEPRLGYKVTEKLRIYAQGMYEKVGYESPVGAIKDNSSTGGLAVASGEFTPRLKGQVGAGAVMRTYVTSSTLMTNSVTLPTWNAAVTYEAPADITVTVALSQAANEGVYNRYNVSMLNMLQLSRPFSKKVMGSVFGMLIRDTYPDVAAGATSTTKRSDQTVQAGVTVDYAARAWLVIEAQFLLRNRDSNLDVFDYANQVVGLSLNAKY